MAYYNPIHMIPQSTQVSGFSSLGTAVATGGPFVSPRRHRVPQKSFNEVVGSKWVSKTGRPQGLHRPVTFDLIGQTNQGVPMSDLYRGSQVAITKMIAGGNDIVLPGTQRIVFRILWPGYDHFEWTRPLEVTTPSGHMTRGQIAQVVAANFLRFIEKASNVKGTKLEWAVGPTGFKFDQLVLIGLYNVLEDSWQADIAVDVR